MLTEIPSSIYINYSHNSIIAKDSHAWCNFFNKRAPPVSQSDFFPFGSEIWHIKLPEPIKIDISVCVGRSRE